MVVKFSDFPQAAEVDGTETAPILKDGDNYSVPLSLLFSQGEDGRSAYDIAVENGFEGTEQEWLDSLQGEDGIVGEDGDSIEFNWSGTQLGVRIEGQTEYQYVDLQGPAGEDGVDGTNGTDGTNGVSLEFNWNGTELGVRQEGETTFQYVDLRGPKGDPGDDGASAYDIAVSNGFSGTEQEWLDSLQGEDGQDGQDGQNGQDGTGAFGVVFYAGNNNASRAPNAEFTYWHGWPADLVPTNAIPGDLGFTPDDA